jgi:lysophospholipase L1-like esterase
MEPFLFPHPAEYATWEPELHQINDFIRQLAFDNEILFLPLWEDLLSAAKKEGFSEVTTDGIHLTDEGHRILADRWISNYLKQNF